MSDNERRAKWLATWASMGMEAAYYLRDRGQESNGENLERAVVKILDLAEEEIGEDVVRAAIQEITDQWCEDEDLVNDFFAVDGSSPGSRSKIADIMVLNNRSKITQ